MWKNESNVDIWSKILLRNTILDFSNTATPKFHKIYKKWKMFWKCQKKYKILRKFQIFLIFLTNLRVRAQKCEKMNPMQISDPKYFCKKWNKMSKKYKILRNFQIFLIFFNKFRGKGSKMWKNESNVEKLTKMRVLRHFLLKIWHLFHI